MIKNKRGESIKKVFIVPYSHIDWAWRNNRQYFIHRNRQVIFAALDFLNEEKDYYWEGIHKFHTVEDFWENYPEFREKLKKFVQEGRIDLTGSTLMTPLPPWYEEEVMVRNIIYGKKSFEKLFGKVEDLTIYFADVPICFSQFPQFATKFGFKYCVIDRPEIALTLKGIPREFIFQSPDGSRILCNHTIYGGIGFPGGGNHTVLSPGIFEDKIKTIKERLSFIAKTSLVPITYFPDAADWAFPTLNLLEFVRFWNEKIEKSKLTISTHTKYFKELEKYKKDLPIFKGNLDPVSWNGIYGTNGEKSNLALRKTINKLISSEELFSLQNLLTEDLFPEEQFISCWKDISILYAHGGYSTSYVFPEDYQFCENLIKGINNKINKITNSSINLLTKEGEKIFVFNPLSWKREDWIEYNDKAFWIKAPSLGYYFAIPQEKENQEIFLSKDKVENEYYHFGFKDGKLVSIYSKEDKRELVDKSKYSVGEVVIDEGEITLLTANFLKTYQLTYKKEIEILESKPYKVTIGLNATFRENSVHQEITIYARKKEIYIMTEIENKEPNLRYRICLPLALSENIHLFGDDLFIVEEKDLKKEPMVGLTRSNPPKDAFESPLETVARKTKGENKGVFYALGFASLEDKNIGVALFNKGTVGYKVEDNILSNILLRSSKKENLDQYKICPYLLGKGKFVFENAIYPYQSGNRIEVLKKSLEFNFPLFILPNKEPKFSGKLSLLKIGANNIILTAFYKEGDYFHLHLYEAEGKDTFVELKFIKPIKEVKEADFLDTHLIPLNFKENKCTIQFKPFQICNLLVSFSR